MGVEHNLGPYIACEENHWLQIKEIDFQDYIDSSMDEAINCSEFPTQETASKFSSAIHKLGYTCPVDPHKLTELILKYKTVSKWIINQRGNETLRYLSEFKNKK
jgi:hypothetical protein